VVVSERVAVVAAAAGKAAVQSAVVSGLKTVAASAVANAPRRRHLAGGLEAEPGAEAAPDRPGAEEDEHRRAGQAERTAGTVRGIDQAGRAGEAERGVEQVGERDGRRRRKPDPQRAAQDRAHDQERDRPDLGGHEEAKAENRRKRGHRL